MKRKSHLIAVLLAAIVALMPVVVSCSQEPAIIPDGLAELAMEVFSPVEEKLLEIWAPGKVKSFVYKATPTFVQDGDLSNGIVGEQTEWKTVKFYRVDDNVIDTVGHLKASMGYYQPGRWEIEIMALNANGNPVYYGTTGTVYLNAGETNGFIVPLHGVTSIGESASLEVSFTGPRTAELAKDSPQPSMKIVWLDGTEREITTGWSSTNSSRGTVFHSIHLDNLPAGETKIIFTLTQPDGAVVTQETAAVLLVNGETTTVEGSIETGGYMDPSFEIEEDKSEIKVSVEIVEGAVKRPADPDGKSPQVFDVPVFGVAKFNFFPEGANADTWKWYVDGKEAGTGSILVFNKKVPGTYQVTACVWRDEKTASEEFLVIVK